MSGPLPNDSYEPRGRERSLAGIFIGGRLDVGLGFFSGRLFLDLDLIHVVRLQIRHDDALLS
jgi:hypothetical protein